MAVREVYMPSVKQSMDPSKMGPAGPTVNWKEKAAEMEAQKKYELERRELADIRGRPAGAPEPAFKVSGEVNLGKFDVQEQQRQTEARLKEVEEKYEEQLAAISQQSETYREQMTNIRFEMMQKQMQIQIDALMAKLAAGQNTRTLKDELADIRENAALLGLSQAPAAVTDASLQLQILQMNLDAKREEREFNWRMEQDKFAREAKIEEIKANQNVQLEKLKLERDKNAMLANAPELFGMALARGLASGDLPVAPPSPPPRAVSHASPPAGTVESVAARSMAEQGPPKAIEAGEGEAGEVACSECGGVIAISPDTTDAVCSGCGQSFPVRRVAVA
jgi:hypothetical protein